MPKSDPPDLCVTEQTLPDARELRELLQYYWQIPDPQVRDQVRNAVSRAVKDGNF